jgi:PAS domain S-box-containing protein
MKWWQHCRWYHLSALLAGINLFTVVASLGLTHLLLNTYSLSVSDDESWSRHAVQFEQLGEYVGAVNVPANEVIIARTPESARANLKNAVAQYLDRTMLIQAEFGNQLPVSLAAPLLNRLAALTRQVELLQQRGNTVIDLIADGRNRAAGVEIANANQRQAQALLEIRNLCEMTRQLRTAATAKRVAEASFLRWIERAIGLLVVGLVTAIVINGARLARQMHETEAKLGRMSAIVEHSEDAIFSQDLGSAITSWNNGAVHLYGYSKQHAIGLSPAFLIPADRINEAELIEEKVRHGHAVQQFESIRRRKDGRMVNVELTVSPVRNEHGTVVGISQIARDTHVLRASERAMQEAKDASEEANRSKSEFLANMSHEIRTPMTAILGYTDILWNSVERPVEIDAVETIRRNGEHLIHLVDEILDLSKIEAGKLTVESLPVQVSKLVLEVIDLMRIKADAKGLAMRAEFPSQMPETIQTDPTRLRQILINLLSNSIKFTQDGRIRLVVSLKQEPGQLPRMQFEVIDTGIGMNEVQLSKLFQPFSQTDTSTTRKYGGTGLGLAICSRLAHTLGGMITVSSRVCVGTTFSVTICAGDLDGVSFIDPAAEVAPVQKPVRLLASEPRTMGHVLLAEDGLDNQKLIKYMLNKVGMDVTCCDNGVVAHDLALERYALGRPFDLVLMDMQMPILDGYAATRQLRAMGYKGPIVALTANAMSGDREKCMAAGCDDYAMKPIDRYRLVEIVSQYV